MRISDAPAEPFRDESDDLSQNPASFIKPFPRWIAVVTVVAALLVLTFWIIGTPPGVFGKADSVGYAICHRIAERSFFIGDPFSDPTARQMALCARCTGIYLGVMTAFGLALSSNRARASWLPGRGSLALMALFIVIMGADGLNSYIRLFPGVTGAYESQNWLRLITGMLFGIALFQFVFPMFNRMVWVVPDQARVVGSARALLGVVAVGAVVVVLVLRGGPLFAAIFNVLSAAGVVFMLTMIATVLYLNIVNRVGTVSHVYGLIIPLLGGLTLTLIEIGAVNIVRFTLTGTWAGFVIPG